MWKTNHLFIQLERFCNSLMGAIPEMAFECWVEPSQGLFRECFRKEMPAEDVSLGSGVYFISDCEENVLYIGKAGANNLGAEIWQKFRAPTRFHEGRPFFENSSLARWADKEEHKHLLTNGNLMVSAAVIEPKEMASLAEVYLQAWCSRNGGLPH